ncbi:MAG: DUF4886 domain-containing protein [Bacteroidales bacterium]|nr:DUF4886 domain-containing protein [Bacteroidales bacterium]
MNLRKILPLSLFVGALLAGSCTQESLYTITADRSAISDVAANTPGVEAIVVTTDAPYWIVTTPSWITADPDSGVGGGKSTIVTLTFDSNYKNESTTTAPRSGEIEFSGGKTSLIIPVNQLGHTAVIDPSLSIGGIPDMDEFLDFVAAVNDGSSLVRWTNTEGEVELQTDIDLSELDEAWVPIGAVEASGNGNYECRPTGNAFTGIFNGGGHTVRNFKETVSLSEGQTYGLFGALVDATVKNLNVEADLTISAKGTADAGVLAGTVYCSTIENVKVSARITSSGTTVNNKRFTIGGIAGFAYSYYSTEDSTPHDTHIKDCEVTATVQMDCGSNTAAGATGTMYAGMAGFCTSNKGASRTYVEDCVNNGTMTMKTGRASGIVASATYGTIIRGCTNNASQVNTMVNARIAQVCCYLAAESGVVDCVNTGDLTTSDAQTHAAALVALAGDDSCYIEGGTRVANTATIVGNFPKFTGLLCANMNKFNHISDVILDGKTGLYKADGNHEINNVTQSNYMDYIGNIADAYKSKVTNITYVGSGTEPEIPTPDPVLDVEAGFRILFIGNSFSKDAAEHLPGILAAAGLDDIQMVHMYYGGRTVPEHNSNWSTVDDYYCFVCNPGETGWTTYRNKTIEKAAYSGKYDVIAFQEHTGKRVAWEWTAAEKAAVQGLKDKLLTAQHNIGGNPKIYYILSQAYHNISKSENNSRPFTNTDEMWDVVSAQGRTAVEECGFDGVISTGAMLQNLRTSGLNNEMGLTRDGYHMDYGIARYGASCTVFETIIGPFNGNVKLDDNTYRTGIESRVDGEWTTAITDARAPIALKAARYAIENPYTVTDMEGEGAENPDTPPVDPDNITVNSASDLVALATRINSGDEAARIANVTLGADIDLTGITEWLPIGNVSSSGNDAYITGAAGHPFGGTFDGANHTIRNFTATVSLSEKQTWGLFGYLSHATVKDLNVEANLVLSATGTADAGVLAGTAYCSTIENVNVTATITSAGSTASKRFSIGGIAGFAFSSFSTKDNTAYNTLIKNCAVTATVNIDCGSNTGGGATAVTYGGIVGFSTNVQDASRINVENCVNNGTMAGKIGRCSGIVAAAIYGTVLRGCTNNASEENTIVNSRIGLVCCYLGPQSGLIDCVNTGNLTTSDSQTHAAALVALTGDDTCYIEGGSRVANTGMIVGNYPKFTGLLCANMNKFDHISGVILSGKTGLYKADGNHEMNAVNSTNFMDYIGFCPDANKSKLSNISYQQ